MQGPCELEVEILSETKKSWQMTVIGIHDDVVEWFPKLSCTFTEYPRIPNRGKLEVPVWLLKQKGLEDYAL